MADVNTSKNTHHLSAVAIALTLVACDGRPSGLNPNPTQTFQPTAVGSDDFFDASLRVAIKVPDYSTQTLPAQWDTATLHLAHPYALTQDRLHILQKDVDLVPNGGGGYTGGGAFGQRLRPISGYTLTVSLWKGGAYKTLVGERQIPLTLAAGTNNITVPIQVYPALSIGSYAPTSGIPGDVITLNGGGYSLLKFWDLVTLGGTSASVSNSSSSSLQVTFPELAPNYYPWAVQVGTSTASLANFNVLGTIGSVQQWITNNSHQLAPFVASRGNEFMAVWSADDTQAGQYDIWGMRINSSGAAIGAPFTICNSSGNQNRPLIVYNSINHQYMVVWEESNNTDIGLCTVSEDGATRSTPVIQAMSGSQNQLSAVFNSTQNEYFIVWRNDLDIFGQIYTANLTASGSAIPIIAPGYGDTGSATQLNPYVGYSAKGNVYLIAWDNDGAGDIQLWARLINPNGSYKTNPFVVSTNPSDHQIHPAIAVDEETGNFWVVWVEKTNPRHILARKVNTDGTLGATVYALATVGDDKQFPAIVYEPWRKKFVVVWQDKRSANWDVYGQFLNPDGSLWGINFPICTTSNDQSVCAIAESLSTTRSLVVFQDSGNSNDVFGRLVR